MTPTYKFLGRKNLFFELISFIENLAEEAGTSVIFLLPYSLAYSDVRTA